MLSFAKVNTENYKSKAENRQKKTPRTPEIGVEFVRIRAQ
jgi:hypothetical protein